MGVGPSVGFKPLDLEVRSEDVDPALVLAGNLVGERDHPIPAVAAATTTFSARAAASSSATRKAAVAPVTPAAVATAAATRATSTAKGTGATSTAAAGSAALAAASRGREDIVLHVVIADLDTLAGGDVDSVLSGLRPCGVDHFHQSLSGRHQLGVYSRRDKLIGHRPFPLVRSCLMIGEDQLSIGPPGEPALHLRCGPSAQNARFWPFLSIPGFACFSWL
jgi:hypothetical protein